MDHPWFVAAAYGISTIVIAGLILWTVLDGRARRHDITELEASGVRRRSARDQGENR
jgi:heme exporter protein D